MEEIFTTAADTALVERQDRLFHNHPYKHKQRPKKWYNKECKDQKNIVRRLAIKKQQDPSNMNKRVQHSEALKEYKKLCQKKKNIFEQEQIAKLEELVDDDPCEFWKKWKYYGDSFNNSTPVKV